MSKSYHVPARIRRRRTNLSTLRAYGERGIAQFGSLITSIPERAEYSGLVSTASTTDTARTSSMHSRLPAK